MNYLDSLIERVNDAGLREALAREVDGLKKKTEFGLVFEKHLPEIVRLYTHEITVGSSVQRHNESGTIWTVSKIDGQLVELTTVVDGAVLRESATTNDLVVVQAFGSPIFPGFQTVASIQRAADKPYHLAINAENYHALEALLYAYDGQIDVVYIDPPYNTGARDWKYNNDYVGEQDVFRHSKWLSFMERRLRLCKHLLSRDAVVVVTIDEHEIHHLGVLLEQIFPEARIQLVTIVNNAAGVSQGGLWRVEEYAFFCFTGDAKPNPVADDLLSDEKKVKKTTIWFSLIRAGGVNATPAKRANLMYPIAVDPTRDRIVGAGPTLEERVERGEVRGDLSKWRPDLSETVNGYPVVWPISPEGKLYTWQVSPKKLMSLAEEGFIRVRRFPREGATNRWTISYVRSGHQKRVRSGDIPVQGREPDCGAFIIGDADRNVIPKTVWKRARHDAGKWGSRTLRELLGDVSFDYAKSPYAILDTLRTICADRPDARILDFFAGSGTTLHAVAMLNAEDNGRRSSIMITNNQVDDATAVVLESQGFNPGVPEYDRAGIFNAVLKPRIEAAITGLSKDGHPLSGDYPDGRNLAEGYAENVEFLELKYLKPDLVSLGDAFELIAPLLWMKAGATGAQIRKIQGPWALPDDAIYGVLFDQEQWRGFVDAVARRADVRHVFIVTDSTATFQQICSELPAWTAPSILYEDYLANFEIGTGLYT